MDKYTHSKINLSDNSILGYGLPGDLSGLAQLSLNDLSAALNPCPLEYQGIGYWPMSYVAPPYDRYAQKLSADFDTVVHLDSHSVVATYRLTDLSAVERAVFLEPIAEGARIALIRRRAGEMRAKGDRIGALEYLASKGML